MPHCSSHISYVQPLGTNPIFPLSLLHPQLPLDTLEQVLVNPHVKNSGLALLSHVLAAGTIFEQGATKAVLQFAENMVV